MIVDIREQSLPVGNLIESVFKSRLKFVKFPCREDRWKGGFRRQVGESEITFFKLQARIHQWGLMDGEEGLLAGSRIIDAGDRDVANANRFADEDGGDEGAEKESDGADRSFCSRELWTAHTFLWCKQFKGR